METKTAPTTPRSGTLFQHTTFEKEGRTFRKWTAGAKVRDAYGHAYTTGRDGSMRHATPQFKGNKKQRKRFVRSLKAAIEAAAPDGYEDLKRDEPLKALDLLWDLNAGKWVTTPHVGVPLSVVQQHIFTIVRACRYAPGSSKLIGQPGGHPGPMGEAGEAT